MATVLGEDAPLAYVRSLLESGGDPGTAIAIHFGANEGSVPQEWRANETGVVPGAEHGSHLDVARSNGQGDEMQQGGGVEDARRALRSAETEESEELQLSVGTVAWVLGKEFKLYKSREALQARLAALGAAVIGEGGTRGHSKQEVTLIVIPEGTEVGSVPRSACPTARIVHESWVVRRAMAQRSGLLPPPPTPPPPTPRVKVPTAPVSSCGEKRAARSRGPSAAAATRLARALSERLYLIDRRDESKVSESGLMATRHVFAVLGSTGNVYQVAICRIPSCTCVDHAERKQVCKHLLFVYHKVLRVPHDSLVPLQRALLRTELEGICGLASAAGLAAEDDARRASGVEPSDLVASAAVRTAYARATGGTQSVVGNSSPRVEFVPRRPLCAEPCAICFDDIEADGPDELLAEAQRLPLMEDRATAAAAMAMTRGHLASQSGAAMAREEVAGEAAGPAEAARAAAAGSQAAAAAGPQAAVASGSQAAAETPAPACNMQSPPGGGGAAADSVHYCALGCGRNYHPGCLRRWFESGTSRTLQCPVCRAQWACWEVSTSTDHASASAPIEGAGEGFLNFGQLQPGVQNVRDSSSYSSWLQFHERRREAEALLPPHD